MAKISWVGFLAIAIAGCAVAISPAAGGAPPIHGWPKLTGGAGIAPCREALEMAQTRFRSSETALDWPVPQPVDPKTRVLLARDLADISGGDGLSDNPQVFTKTIRDEGSGRQILYWQQRPTETKRLAIVEEPIGWRGDLYTVYAADLETTPDALFDATKDGNASPKFKPVWGGDWTPPLMLAGDAGVWFIGFRDSWFAEPDWHVFTFEKGQIDERCAISFKPAIKNPLTLLPGPVQRLAGLLDQALGPGENEGTLQPTSWIRTAVVRDWGTAALRPWALHDTAYNRRDEVEAGLNQWASQSRKRAAALRVIRAQLAPAEASLGRFYAAEFGLSGGEAEAMARYVIDVMVRDYFVFHIEDKLRAPVKFANPWPVETRRSGIAATDLR